MRKVTVSRMRERFAQTVFTFRISYVFKSMQNRAFKTVAHHFVLYLHFTTGLSFESYDLHVFITLKNLSVHVSSAFSQGMATK